MSSGYVLSDEVLDHKINEPAYSKKSSYKAERSLNDLDLFTKGQPVDFYKELRDNAPIYFHDPMPTDPEPGYWVLTRHEDIKHVSMNPKIFSSQYATGNLLTLYFLETNFESSGDLSKKVRAYSYPEVSSILTHSIQ